MNNDHSFEIAGRRVGPQFPPYFIAEMSGNHQHCIEQARALIKCAKKVGADAVKIQTYTADSLTLPVRNETFKIDGGPWKGSYLYDLYKRAYTPWEWHEELADYARKIGITLFSTPFDEDAVDYLETTINPPVYKIASFEITHIPLLKKVASTGKPVLLSTGMATMEEIEEAIQALRDSGNKQLLLLKCISAYPADPKDFNLRSISLLQKKFNCLVGLSDHSLTESVALGAVVLGASIIEKHLVLKRGSGAVDEDFSLMPDEFTQMILKVKDLYDSLGEEKMGPSQQEQTQGQMRYRRSIFVSKDIAKGEMFSAQNLKIVRPAEGLHPRHWTDVLGKKAKHDLSTGTPLSKENFS